MYICIYIYIYMYHVKVTSNPMYICLYIYFYDIEFMPSAVPLCVFVRTPLQRLTAHLPPRLRHLASGRDALCCDHGDRRPERFPLSMA